MISTLQGYLEDPEVCALMLTSCPLTFDTLIAIVKPFHKLTQAGSCLAFDTHALTSNYKLASTPALEGLECCHGKRGHLHRDTHSCGFH